MSSTAPTFLGIPTEIRLIIYDYVFQDPLDKARPVTNLVEKVPFSSSLRSTCKFIHDESTDGSYQKAMVLYDARRKNMIKELYAYYETMPTTPPGYVHPYGRRVLRDLGTTLVQREKGCKHACKDLPGGCYMCDDPKHRVCYECGRNFVLALWCKTFDPKAVPKLVLPHSSDSNTNSNNNNLAQDRLNGNKAPLTPFGQLHDAQPLNAHRYIEHGFVRHTWAFDWWRAELLRQTAMETRIAVRLAAREKVLSQAGTARFADFAEFERLVQAVERRDKRLASVERIVRTCWVGRAWGESMDWRAEMWRREDDGEGMRRGGGGGGYWSV